jgi:hypothetical protein
VVANSSGRVTEIGETGDVELEADRERRRRVGLADERGVLGGVEVGAGRVAQPVGRGVGGVLFDSERLGLRHGRAAGERGVHGDARPVGQHDRGQPHRSPATEQGLQRRLDRLAPAHRRGGRAGFEPEAGGGDEDVLEVGEALVAGDAGLQRGHRAVRRDQGGDDGVRGARVQLARGLLEQRLDRRAAGHAAPGEVQPLEGVGGGLGARARGEVLERGPAGGGGAEALRLVHGAALRGDLAPRAAQKRAVAADVHAQKLGHVRVGRAVPGRDVLEQPVRLPRRQAQLREALGIRGGREGLGGQQRRGRVVAVVGALGGEARDDDVGPDGADGPHHVGEHAVVAPESQGLFGVFGVSEVAGAGEELPGAIDRASGEQLQRAGVAEQLGLLGADEVLAAAAAGQREVGRVEAALADHPREQAGVLVVRMRGHVEHAAGALEPVDGQGQGAGRGRLGDGLGREEHGEQQDRGHGETAGPWIEGGACPRGVAELAAGGAQVGS